MEKYGEEKVVLNTKGYLSLVWLAAYDVIGSASTKLPGPQACRPVVMVAVAVVIVPFFAAIIITTWQSVGASSLSDVVLRQTRFREIIDVAAFNA